MLLPDLLRCRARTFRAAARGRVFGKRAIMLAKRKSKIAKMIHPSHQAPSHLEYVNYVKKVSFLNKRECFDMKQVIYY